MVINLTDEFYSLMNDGYIYDEDENGLNMSYGEYAAISDYLNEMALKSIEGYDFLKDYNDMIETLRTADDDTESFMGGYLIEQFDKFYFEYDSDANTIKVDGKCPECLVEEFNDWVELNGVNVVPMY